MSRKLHPIVQKTKVELLKFNKRPEHSLNTPKRLENLFTKDYLHKYLELKQYLKEMFLSFLLLQM